jgi:threonine/homoserine/homoserine lactone efflux protein
MLLVLVSACGLGFGAGASFGPVNLEITRVGLVGRAREPVPLAVGAWLGDALLLTTLGALVVVANDVDGLGHDAQPWLRAVSAVLIVLIAFRSLRRLPPRAGTGEYATSTPLVAAKGIALSALSPFGIVLWSGMAAAAKGSGHMIPFAAVILLGDGAWFVLWLNVLRKLRSRIPAGAVVPIHIAANASLLACAAMLVFA